MPLTPYGKAERDSARLFVRRHYPAVRIKAKRGYLWVNTMAYGFVVTRIEQALARVVYVKRIGPDYQRPRVWEFC